jgi:hypothetical protein
VLVENVVIAREQGQTPEEIQGNFPSLSLIEVYGAILYYLEHKEELDARFAEDERVADERWAAYRASNAEFFDRMHARFEEARRQRRERAEQVGEAAEA